MRGQAPFLTSSLIRLCADSCLKAFKSKVTEFMKSLEVKKAGLPPLLGSNITRPVGQFARKSAIIRGSCKAIHQHRRCEEASEGLNFGYEQGSRAGISAT